MGKTEAGERRCPNCGHELPRVTFKLVGAPY